MAKRDAQAHSIPEPADARTNIERAEQALAERVRAFTEASEALRAEIKAFEATRAEAEGRPPEPVLRLVVSRETAEMEAIEEADAAETDEDERPTPTQIAEFFRIHEERDEVDAGGPGPPPSPGMEIAGAPVKEIEARPRNLARERLYADLGGAAIGICSAAALINFVLLK